MGLSAPTIEERLLVAEDDIGEGGEDWAKTWRVSPLSEAWRLRSGQLFHASIWWPAFLVIQYTALFVVGSLEPAGFDRCEGMPSPDAQSVQTAVASVAVAGSAALALWRLRRWHLVAALVAVVCSSLVWVWLLSGNCPDYLQRG
jgi:hypothetical protein